MAPGTVVQHLLLTWRKALVYWRGSHSSSPTERGAADVASAARLAPLQGTTLRAQAYLSAETHPAQTGTRLPQTHAHRRRPCRAQTPPSPRAQAPDRRLVRAPRL